MGRTKERMPKGKETQKIARRKYLKAFDPWMALMEVA